MKIEDLVYIALPFRIYKNSELKGEIQIKSTC